MRDHDSLKAAAVLGGLLAAGCADPTELMVELDSDLQAPVQMDAIRLRIVSRTGGEKTSSYLVHGAGDPTGYELPMRIALVPGTREEYFTVQATAMLGDKEIVKQEFITYFRTSEARVLTMFLSRTCIDVGCDALYTCATGVCIPQPRDPTMLPKYKPGLPPSTADAVGGQDADDPDAGAAD